MVEMVHPIVLVGAVGAGIAAGTGATYVVALKAKERTLRGTYVFVGNPCFTDPCIPGTVYAVKIFESNIYLTKNEGLLWENEPGIPAETPVRVTGKLWTKEDIFGEDVVLFEYSSIESLT